MKEGNEAMKKKLAIIAALLLAAVLLLSSCASQENNGEKKFTARDIEGTWTVNSEASSAPRGDLIGLEGFMVSTKVDDSAVVIFRNGKITAEWQTQEGKQTSDLGDYEVVNEGDLIINGFKAEPTLEGRKLTLYQFIPKEEGAFMKVDGKYMKLNEKGEVSKEAAIGDETIMVLERK